MRTLRLRLGWLALAATLTSRQDSFDVVAYIETLAGGAEPVRDTGESGATTAAVSGDDRG